MLLNYCCPKQSKKQKAARNIEQNTARNVVHHHFRAVDHQLWNQLLHTVKHHLNFATKHFYITAGNSIKNSRIMKKMILSIAIILVTAGLAAPSAMAREMRGDAMSHRPGVEMRGPWSSSWQTDASSGWYSTSIWHALRPSPSRRSSKLWWHKLHLQQRSFLQRNRPRL